MKYNFLKKGEALYSVYYSDPESSRVDMLIGPDVGNFGEHCKKLLPVAINLAISHGTRGNKDLWEHESIGAEVCQEDISRCLVKVLEENGFRLVRFDKTDSFDLSWSDEIETNEETRLRLDLHNATEAVLNNCENLESIDEEEKNSGTKDRREFFQRELANANNNVVKFKRKLEGLKK